MCQLVLSIVPYEVHPHVAIVREFLGYSSDDTTDVDDDTYLKSLDPKDWKTQDHYAILGLKQKRHMASTEEIRQAYRRKILKHHPDKRRSQGENIGDESHDYFSCITIAYEILGNPTKRHAYDSVDPLVVDDSVPSASEIKRDYFGCLRSFFNRKARWSQRQPVPVIGHEGTHIDDVHRFYDFWENYDTNRDYSYLDEEDKERGEDRESRRAIERQNRAERARRRAEELRNIRQVVELARSSDPRLIAAAKAVRDAKLAKRQARLDAAREKREAEEAQARLEAERVAAARAASEERRRLETERLKKEREQNRLEAKRERRRLRSLVMDQFHCFQRPDQSTSDADANRVRVLADMDLVCQRLSHTQLTELNEKLETAGTMDDAHSVFVAQLREIQQELQAPGLQPAAASSHSPSSAISTQPCKLNPEVIQALVKAVNLLPAGTPKRWDAIADYVNQHVPGTCLSSKDALKQAKALSQDNSGLRKEANDRAFTSFTQSARVTDAVKNVQITSQLEADVSRPWTLAEQRALEQALRTCPAQVTANDPTTDRWQRIADLVGTRTKRECMLRCKELSEQVKAKKAALAATQPATLVANPPKSK